MTNPSVNESKQEEDEPLATTSQKLDDERILEALEVHEKLKWGSTFVTDLTCGSFCLDYCKILNQVMYSI